MLNLIKIKWWVVLRQCLNSFPHLSIHSVITHISYLILCLSLTDYCWWWRQQSVVVVWCRPKEHQVSHHLPPSSQWNRGGVLPSGAGSDWLGLQSHLGEFLTVWYHVKYLVFKYKTTWQTSYSEKGLIFWSIQRSVKLMGIESALRNGLQH